MMCDDIVERTVTNERLKRLGWKVYADTTLGQWKKKDLIDLIRCLEHNYSAMIERWENSVQYAESKIKELEQKLQEKVEFDEELN